MMGTEKRDLLHSLSAHEQSEGQMSRKRLFALRLAAFSEAVSEMTIPDELNKWVGLMAAFYPGGVTVWGNKMPWLEALMVVRYGEDTRSWPTEFSAADVQRADTWLHEKHPDGVSYPQATSERALLGSLAVLGLLGFLYSANTWDLSWLFLFPLFGTAMTDYLENKFADHLFRTTAFTKPTVLAVALYTAAPGETGGGTEVAGGAYARVQNNPLDANWNGTHGNTTGVSSGTGGVVSNAGVLTFPTPTANWGTITHMAILDAATAGNFLVHGALTTAKTVNNGDPAPTFPATTLALTFA